MLQQEGLKKLATIIKTDYRHKYYADNCELYEKYLTLSTGRGWEKFLHRLTSRVTAEEFTQIIEVTIDLCKAVVKNLTHVFYRVTRSIGVKVEWTVDETGKKEDYQGILKTFGRFGYDGYMDKRFTDFCKIDPNGYLVIDFLATDGTKYARPYPVEFYSPDVIDYDYELNQLIYLVVKQDLVKPVDETDHAVSDYTIYTKEGAVKFIRHPEKEYAAPYDENKVYENGDFVSLRETIVKNEKGKEETLYEVYEILIPIPYDMEWVPAICTGYLTDEYHRGETYLNFFDNSVPLLEKVIKANSESDISMAKHCFAQKIQFVRPCPNGCECNNEGVFCVDNSVCHVCGGSGSLEYHRTGMDAISFPLTDSNIENIDLDNIIKYVSPDLETIKYQWEHIGELIEMAKRVMYNSEMFSRETIAETATAKLLEMQNMIDTLYIYAVHFADVKAWVLKTISAITDIKITVTQSVSKDLKLLGKAELLSMLQLANTAGANSAVIEAINDELVYSFYGDGSKYQLYLEKKRLLPFQNKSKEQTMLILGSLPETHTFRLMFQFGEEIINMLDATYDDWDTYSMEKKQVLIQKELDKIEAEILAEKTESNAPAFGAETTV